MSIAEKLTRIAENEQRVFDAGYAKGKAAADGAIVDPDKIIEATATGVGSVYLDDVSEVNHDVKIKTAAGAKVKTFVGKNLLSDAVYNLDNWVWVEGIDINSQNSKCYFLDEIPNGTYTISAKSSVNSVYLYFYYSEDNGVTWKAYSGQNGTNYIIAGANSYTITFDKPSDIRFLIWSNNTYYHESIEYIQIEVGDTATEYEPYKEPITYTADSNGVANGRSISPMMFIATDGSSEITVEYRKSWGMQAGHERFWKNFLGGVQDFSFLFAGRGWKDSTFDPHGDITVSGGSANGMFFNTLITDLDGILQRNGVKLDVSRALSLNELFSYSRSLTVVPEITIGESCTAIANMFSEALALVTVRKLKFLSTALSSTSNAFRNCTALENITFEGVITTDINLQWSPRLSRASIDSIYNAAHDSNSGVTSNTLTLSKAAVDKAYETSNGANDGSESDEWQTMINMCGFTITLV